MPRPSRGGRPEKWVPMRRALAAATGTHEMTIDGERFTIWRNELYTCLVRDTEVGGEFPAVIHLSMRRNDRGPFLDWRDMQRIKNDIVGPEHEGWEIFPAESRLVDTSNQRHLWVFKDPAIRFPVGFAERLVAEGSSCGAVQRPFGPDRPADCKTPAESDRMTREYIAKGGGVSGQLEVD